MSKSTGNLIFVRELTALHEPMVVRLAVMSQHYRSTEWTWSDDLLPEAVERLTLWRSSGRSSGPRENLSSDSALLDEVRACLDDDLNVPAALELMDVAARRGDDVEACAELLGVVLASQRSGVA